MDRFGRTYWVYILASRKHGTLYIGVTSDLSGRVYEHKAGITPGLTSRYGVHMLVYFEMFGVIEQAIAREKQLKRWRRDWKINLIERSNPNWVDLYAGIYGSRCRPDGRTGMTISKEEPQLGRWRAGAVSRTEEPPRLANPPESRQKRNEAVPFREKIGLTAGRVGHFAPSPLNPARARGGLQPAFSRT
jgi:putative endonuclease